MTDRRTSTTGQAPPSDPPAEGRAEDRGMAVGGDVENSLMTTGDGNTQIGGDVWRAGRDLVHAGRDFNQHFHNISPSKPTRAPLTAPAPPEHFTGRAETLDDLASRLVSGESVGLTALQGMGGIGKTAVALKLAERLRTEHSEDFPGGVLWCSLGPDPEVLTVLDAWARAARPDADLSTILDPGARAVAVRQLLANQGRFCAIVDDVWDAEDARLLFEALPPDSPRLITTRLGDVAKSLRCTIRRLDRLSRPEALTLIAKHLGNLGSFEPAARQVVEQTEAMPLAIEIAVGLIEEPSDLPGLLVDLARRSRLVVLTSGKAREDSIEICFSLSYNRLDDDDQRRFRALGAFADAPFEDEAVAAVWGEDEVDTTRLRFFGRRNLLQRNPSTGVLRLHGLLKEYAQKLLEQEGEAEGTRGRHAEHYRSLASSSADWKSTETVYEQIQHGWNHAKSEKGSAVQYVLSCVNFQKARGHWQDRESWLDTVLSDHHLRDNSRSRGLILLQMGSLYSDKGQNLKALSHYQRALEIFRRNGDQEKEGLTLNNVGAAYSALGQKDKALQCYQAALGLFQSIGSRRNEATAYNNLGSLFSSLGRSEKALRLFHLALEIRREVGDLAGESTTQNNIAAVYSALGRKKEALVRFKKTLEILREIGNRFGEGTTLNNIALTYDALGKKQEALMCHREALSIRRAVGDRGGEAVSLNNIGLIYGSLGREIEALRWYEEALSIYREVGDRGGEASTLNNLALLDSNHGRPVEARRRYEKSLAIQREIGSRTGEAITLHNLASLNSALGHKEEAFRQYQLVLEIRTEVGDLHGEGKTLNNMGAVSFKLGNREGAAEFYERAIEVFRKVGDEWGESGTLYNLGATLRSQGRLREAVESLESSIAISRNLDHPDFESDRAFLAQVRRELAESEDPSGTP